MGAAVAVGAAAAPDAFLAVASMLVFSVLAVRAAVAIRAATAELALRPDSSMLMLAVWAMGTAATVRAATAETALSDINTTRYGNQDRHHDGAQEDNAIHFGLGWLRDKR